MQTRQVEPLWASALLAASRGCRQTALQHQIQWRSGAACLRFTNAGMMPVAIPELGVQLAAGSTLEVSWPAGATAYEFRVRGNRSARVPVHAHAPRTAAA